MNSYMYENTSNFCKHTHMNIHIHDAQRDAYSKNHAGAQASIYAVHAHQWLAEHLLFDTCN